LILLGTLHSAARYIHGGQIRASGRVYLTLEGFTARRLAVYVGFRTKQTLEHKVKRIFLACAVAFAMCAATSASAKIVSISFDGLCDGLDMIVNKDTRMALEVGNGCDEGAHFGAGTIGRIKGQGNAITFGVNLHGKGVDTYQYIFVISYPFVTGGAWSNFYTQDGKTFSRISTGTYTVNGGARHQTKGLKSSTDRPH
jgi:hypothetical protein